MRANDNHQLIDDEEEESEEDEEMLLQGDDESLDQQTLQFTLDPQTHQMLQGGEQVVVFEVVQMNNAESGNEENDTEHAFADASFETPKKGGIITKKALARTGLISHTNGASTSSGKLCSIELNQTKAFANLLRCFSALDNIIIQLQAEDEEAASAIQGDDIIDDPDFTPSRSIKIATLPANVPAAVPPPVIVEDTKSLREQLQKQKDMANCFGFQDDDSEDEAILSMPAAHAQ